MYYYDITLEEGTWNGSCDRVLVESFNTFEEAVLWAEQHWPYNSQFKESEHDQNYVGFVFQETVKQVDWSEDTILIRRMRRSS